MGERNRDRQLADARAAYVGAAYRFRRALAAFDGSGMAMDPGPDPAQPYPWTGRQWAIFDELTGAVDRLVTARRDWDQMRREWRAPH